MSSSTVRVPRASLATSEGALVSVSIHIHPRYLEALLEALARIDFPINPQIYHDAEIVTVHADGSEEKSNAGEDAEETEYHERACIRRRREHRREQRAWRREAHLDQIDDALVDVQLSGPLRGIGEVAEDRREPLGQEVAVGEVGAVVDRALRLRPGPGEVEDQLRPAGLVLAGLVGTLL